MTKEIGRNTPLHKLLPIAKASALIKQGADVDAIGQYGARPLHIAAFRGDAELVKLLIKAGADVNASGPGESTPLHQLACMFGAKVKRADYPKVLRLLIEAGASTEKQNDCGKRPIDAVTGTKQKREFLKIIAEMRSERDEKGENMIKEIEIRGIGPIEKRKRLVFKPGVNIIVGRNASGKTYLLRVLEMLNGGKPQDWGQTILEMKNQKAWEGFVRMENEKGAQSVMVIKQEGLRNEILIDASGAQKTVFVNRLSSLDGLNSVMHLKSETSPAKVLEIKREIADLTDKSSELSRQMQKLEKEYSMVAELISKTEKEKAGAEKKLGCPQPNLKVYNEIKQLSERIERQQACLCAMRVTRSNLEHERTEVLNKQTSLKFSLSLTSGSGKPILLLDDLDSLGEDKKAVLRALTGLKTQVIAASCDKGWKKVSGTNVVEM